MGFFHHFFILFVRLCPLQKRSVNRLSYNNKRYNNDNHHEFGSTDVLNKSIISVKQGRAKQYLQTVPSSTVNPIYEYSEEKVAVAERDFQQRRDQLWKMCIKYDMVDRYPPNAWEFFISSGHGIAWCNVFKAASSTWMYYFNILGKCYCHCCWLQQHIHSFIIFDSYLAKWLSCAICKIFYQLLTKFMKLFIIFFNRRI